jgi:DNA-binding IclR family transcriptional regulator
MNESRNTLQTLDRAQKLLEILANSPNPLSVAEISRRLSTNRTTVYAMVNSLAGGNFIHKDRATGKYTIGYKVFELGQKYRYRFPFLAATQSHIIMLVDKWKLNTYVSIYIFGGENLIIEDSYPSSPRILNNGSKTPAYATAMGKVLMAGLCTKELKEEIQRIAFKPFTPNTIINPERFLQELDKIRQQGYAIDDEEYVNGISCCAAPIQDVSGKTIAALSISGETERITDNSTRIIRDVMLAAQSISHL